MPDFAKKPGGILVGIMSSSKKPPRADDDEPSRPAPLDAMGGEDDEEEEGGSPLTPEERGSLGDDLNSAMKSGDGVAVFDALEAIVRACKESY